MLPSLARLSSRTLMSTASISRLVRFAPRSQPAEVLIGEPVDRELDVGLASYAKDPIEVEVYSGTSVLCPGHRTERREVVDRLLSPVSEQEIGTIRCIGLNVGQALRVSRSWLMAVPPPCRRSQDARPLCPYRLSEAIDVPWRPLPRTYGPPQGVHPYRFGRLRIRAGSRDWERLQERLGG